MDDPRKPGKDPSGYEPPGVEDLPAQDGPAVTAADAGGESPIDIPDGPEWRPTAPEGSSPDSP